jgi:septal ring factor EnvC (AmiA/AmiB activator)
MIKEENKIDISEIAQENLFGGSFAEQFAESSKKAQVSVPEKKMNINNSILLDIITDQTRAKFVWQCICGGLVLCVVAVAFIGFNQYKSNQNLNEKLADFATLEPKLNESKAETEKLKSEIFEAGNELKAAKAEANTYKNQTSNLQDELDKVNAQLKDMQDRNAEVAKILNGRLQKLSSSSK